MTQPRSRRLVTVGLILSVVLAVAALLIMSQCERERVYERQNKVADDIRALREQLEDYKSRNGAYPTTEQGLGALGAVPKDPWLSDYIYTCPSIRNRESYDLFSAGLDQKPDTPDDDWGEREER